MSDTERSQMDDRVHAALIADGLSVGMTSDEALHWADSRMKSTQAALIAIDLAGNDLIRELRRAAEKAGAKVARALGR
jgi:hypothetical protein